MGRRVTQQRKNSSERLKEVVGILLLGISAFILLSLVSYDPFDISLNSAQPNDPAHNYIGLIGAWYSFITLFLFGFAAFLVPFLTTVLGIGFFIQGTLVRFWTWIGSFFVSMMSLSCLLELQAQSSLYSWAQKFGLIQLGPGGLMGEWVLKRFLVKFIGIEGSYILLYCVFAASIVYLLGLRLTKSVKFIVFWIARIFLQISRSAKQTYAKLRDLIKTLKQRRLEKAKVLKAAPTHFKEVPVTHAPVAGSESKSKRVVSASISEIDEDHDLVAKPLERKKEKDVQIPKTSQVQLELISHGEFQLPPLSLLEDVGPSPEKGTGTDDLQRNAEILKNTLAEFGVEVEVVNITRGPVITRYELQPAPGVKVQRIVGLSNDIALAMKASSVRIVAPIPGKAAVGIEIPNSTSTVVYLKELLISDEFKNAQKRIPLALGKDVSGIPIVADLTEMPHLLIAGATGSGKSICINSIILSILYYASPDYIRFMMVDPKMVELSIYNDIPHLVLPVVTDARKASGALAWLVAEMERRYKVLAEVGVRNIEIFNDKVAKEKVLLRNSEEPLKPYPYIVVIIDELADIMMVSSYEVENSIARLAQLSRAIGIHLILATQRPSVDVITGIIKANFSARISFQVASKVDSRTVLDAIGADKLIGKGDMLFMPPGSSKLIRAQGVFVRDGEMRRVLDFVKGQKVAVNTIISSDEILQKTQGSGGDFNQMDDDTLVEEAIKIIQVNNQASVSILQRKLRIGYSRAARIMDFLEDRGVVGPYKGSKARDILIDMETKEG